MHLVYAILGQTKTQIHIKCTNEGKLLFNVTKILIMNWYAKVI